MSTEREALAKALEGYDADEEAIKKYLSGPWCPEMAETARGLRAAAWESFGRETVSTVRALLSTPEGSEETWDELDGRQSRERIRWQLDRGINTRSRQEEWIAAGRPNLARLRTGTEREGP